jgi:hypothetical protein
MDLEGSLQCSQQPVSGLYPELDEPIYIPEPISLRSILCCSPIYVYVLLVEYDSFRFTYQNAESTHLLSDACYLPCPSTPPCLDHANYTWRGVQVMKLVIIKFSPASRYSIPLLTQILFSAP